ncbi:MAG: glycosyltransferase family 2 protein [Gaiellaceae bacterium]
MTRVAVVIPCYDDGATLPEALESLGREEPHEVVVVDDGSTDPETLRVLGDLRRNGIHVARRENGGLSAARMTGVEATSAPYVFPLDADDALAPGALAALADALDARPQAALAWGDVEIWGAFEARLAVARSLDPWLLTYVNDVPVASLIRRSALEQVGGWSMGSGYEDWDLWLSLAEHGYEGVHVPLSTFRYRRRGGRMLEDCLPRHGELVDRLRSRHAALFQARSQNRPNSTAPARVRLVFPVIERLPFLQPSARHRLYLLVNRPYQIVSLRRLRRARRADAAVEVG